ncbi:MAG: M1 family peptidase [Flavobacterium sp.]|nr:MAG: M1 family peptidase [Flavobacterium sp.]
MKQNILIILLLSINISITGQNNTAYWQQHVDYSMEIDVNVKTYQYKGKQTAVYTNNSPDALDRIFYHLHFNAFQPGSEMDVRSRTIVDPDSRVGDRISKLSPSELGYLKPTKLTQDGVALKYNVAGTVLEVSLNRPIQPGESTTFYMEWDAQVPVQIRRSGRNNRDGVALSMTQWYPKIAEYDFQGWHADPYIGREFHGVWGNFDVKITIDADYTIGGTGYLQNAEEVGHGYGPEGLKPMKPKNGKYTWHFVAPKVHDFTWAADNEYIHDKLEGPNGVMLHFLYKNDPKVIENWKKIQPKTAELMEFYNENIGSYPYKQYSVIQGGDGGMEYGMCTLITGGERYRSLLGTTSHELAHSWFQFVLATNESKHEWMDEGFTSYISARAMAAVNNEVKENPWGGSFRGYKFLATSGMEQPQSTHADRYATNRSYGIAAYSKGAVFLAQLGYVIGEENLNKTLKRYFADWSFKHPTPNDFIRVAEKISGFELDWYLTDWTQTTNTIDYAIKEITPNKDATIITLERLGLMPMPIDLFVTFEDGSSAYYYIPLQMARAEKENPYPKVKRVVSNDWAWAYPTYDLQIPGGKKVTSVQIDPSGLMADINMENNSMVVD